MIYWRCLRPADDHKPVPWLWFPISPSYGRMLPRSLHPRLMCGQGAANLGDMVRLWLRSMEKKMVKKEKTTLPRSSHLQCRIPLRYCTISISWLEHFSTPFPVKIQSKTCTCGTPKPLCELIAPKSNCRSSETPLHINLQSSHTGTCYYHQDLHTVSHSQYDCTNLRVCFNAGEGRWEVSSPSQTSN